MGLARFGPSGLRRGIGHSADLVSSRPTSKASVARETQKSKTHYHSDGGIPASGDLARRELEFLLSVASDGTRSAADLFRPTGTR